MSQSIQLQVTQVGLEQSIAAAMKRVGNSSQINLGTNSKQINALSQPLGRITGQADEFSKSMAAANARVLAFGASAGIIAGVSAAMGGLLASTIKVEKSLVEIGSVLNKSGGELDKFGQGIFNVAKNTGKSFDEVASGALELARQGLNAEDTLNRLNDALILSRLSGLDAKQSVEGLTAAFNSFKQSGITTSEILNKVVAVSQKFAVSERDIIEGLGRSASVADLAGVSFEELSAIITAVQEKTARGGAVIGNSFKTIFARIQDKAVLSDLDDIGIAVTDLQGNVLPALKILENLAAQMGEFSPIKQADIAKKLGGVYQLDKLLAALKDLSSESSVYRKALAEQERAGTSAYQKNAVLNTTLASLINKVTVSAEQLGAKLGEIGVTDSLKNVLGFFNNLLEGIQKILGEESGLGILVTGLAKGIGNLLSGPGLALFAGIILKLSKDLVQFGFASLKAFFGIGKAAKEVQNVESSISQILAKNVNLQQQLFNLEGNRAAQLRVITTALVEQEALLRRSAGISSGLAPELYNAGVRAGSSGLRIGNSAGGYMPAVAKENASIRRGVGGARTGDKPVIIPNFSFGGGKKGSIVAHTGEYVIPNFAGSNGSAIFNRDMVRSMGLPEGARKINAAGGFIPNFVGEGGSYNKNRTIEEAKKYFGKAKKETAIAAFENPNTSENDLIGASESLLKGKSLAYSFDASKFQFQNGMGIGVVSLTNEASSSRGKLTTDNENIQKILAEIGVPSVGKVLESKFRERNIDPNSLKGSKEKLLGLKPNIAFENIKVGSVNELKGQFASETFKDFQQTTNGLFAQPLADLSNITFGKSLGNIDSRAVEDKFLFGKDVLGNIFESAAQFYIKGVNSLPSFQDGESNRNQRFDFPMSNADEATKLNSLFFKNGGVGKAEAKLTANAKSLNSVVSKSLADPEVISQMKNQIASRTALTSAAGGFIPNFVNQQYVMETLARIKAGTSGFSKQEQETFLNKFGAKSTGRKMSIRDVYDKLDGEIGISQLIDRAYAEAGPTASNENVFKAFEKQIKANPNQLRSLVSQKGFVPNFADPLKEAIGREMSAGVPSSQIYVDKNSSLKNAMNPMGLMVANRRDEPAGGFQGINRARREGADPMMYGAAGGFVPNYASLTSEVSKQTGIRIDPGPAQQAIDKFAKQSAAAGANMEELTKALSKTLASITSENVISKQLAEVAKKQIEQKKEETAKLEQSIANRTLENQSNKKLAKKLDKIYLEYNKSEKTTQDLQRAQDKAAAVLNKTQLPQRAQTAIVSSTGSLASNRPNAQGGAGRDTLGTIFAVQGALSVLTGATDGASNSLAKYTNVVSSGIGSFATAAFAIQGVTQMGGAMGALATKLGPYGLAIAGAFAGFSILGKAIDEYTKVNKYAADSMARLAEATQRAAVKLEDLSPTAQAKIERSAKDLVSGAARYEVGSEGGLIREKVEFEGFDYFGMGTSETEKSLQNIAKESLAAGVSYDEMFKIINKASKDGEMSKEDVEDIQFELEKLITTAENVKKAFGGLNLNIESGIGKTLVDTKNIENLSGRSALISSKARADAINKLKEELKRTNPNLDINSPAALKLIDDQVKALDSLAASKKEQEDQDIAQARTSIVQDKLKNALAITIAKARSFENDQLKNTLLTAQELSNLDEKGLRDLQDKIALREIDRKLTDETRSIIESQIDKAKEISSNAPEALALEEKFKALTEEDLRNPEKLKEILEETNSVLSRSGELTDAQVQAINQKIAYLIEDNKLQKDSLSLEQKRTGEYKEQAKQLNLISQASKRALEAQSFTGEIQNIRAVNTDALQIRALESSKLGASDSQVRQIDQQIAAIKANTVALEQSFAREKIFQDVKKELSQNNQSLNKNTKANLDKDIKEADTIKEIRGLAGIIFGSRRDKTPEQNAQDAFDFIQKFQQNLETQDEAARQASLQAAADVADAGRISPVIDALEMFRRSLLETSQIIDQKIEDIKLQQLTSISGRELLQGNYDIETLRMQEGKTETEAARIARERQNKSVSQLFNEEFGKTEEERALDMKKTIVDASVQFKNNMIEGIMGAVEGTSSLKDGLRSAAYEFVKTINQRMMNNLIDKVVGGSVQSGTGQTGGGLVGFLSGMFGMASGGMINGGSGMKDDVPAMLMGGEYVVNKKAVSKYGAQFLESINNGTLTGYAKGGKVQTGPQGNFYTPGTFGQGAIEGKRNLLDFATQTGTSGQFDQIINELGYQSVSLEPESSRLSVSGMRNSPQFEATQSAKQQAFDLYLQQYNAEKEAKKAEEAQKKAFRTQLLMLAVSAGLGAVGSVAGTGAKTALANLPKNAGVLEKLMTAASGAFKGGNIAGTGQMAGGLKNLFSGNFATAFRSGIPLKAGAVGGSYGNVAVGAARSGAGVILDGSILPQFNSEDKFGKTSGYYPSYQVFGKRSYLLGGGGFGSLLPPKNAIGGMIPSTSGIDTVPAMLSGGEFVMNRSAVQGIGAQNLQSMNSGGTSITSEETSKELNEKLLAKLDELINSSGSTGNITINVAPSGQTTQETSQDPSAGRQQLARQIKDAVLQIINDEKRIGGSLRR